MPVSAPHVVLLPSPRPARQNNPGLSLSATRAEFRVEVLTPPDLTSLGQAGRPSLIAVSTSTLTMGE